MYRQKTRKRGALLPFQVIEAASGGDVDAINRVLKHYESYIIVLATRRLYDDNGNYHLVVDHEMRRTLETKLIVKILQFDLDRAA